MKKIIEELKNNKLDIEKHNELFASAWNSSIDNCCSVLKQYHLITAPKSIKLSELLGKLNKLFEGECYIKRIFKSPIYIVLQDDIVMTISKDLKKILNIEFNNTFIELKWLYTLWIAGTIIEDDMEEKE